MMCRVHGRCLETPEILIYTYIEICRFESSLCNDNQRVGRSRGMINLLNQVRKTVSIMQGSFNEWMILIFVTIEVEMSIEIWIKPKYVNLSKTVSFYGVLFHVSWKVLPPCKCRIGLFAL